MNIFKEITLNQLIKLPFVMKMALKQHSTGRNNDPIQVLNIFENLNKYVDFRYKNVLELGPGQTFGILERAKIAGAKELFAVDIMTYVEDIPSGINYKHYDGKTILLPNDYFDVIWSWSVFEHIRYPKITVPETYRLLKKGGIAIHSIDLVDHFNYTWQKDELTFNCLKYPEWLWNLMTWNRSNYVNRIRIGKWIELFKNQGFEIVHLETKENQTIKELHKDGKIGYLNKYSESDASTMSMFIVLKK